MDHFNLGIPKHYRFLRLYHNGPSERLVALLRDTKPQEPFGRLFTRRLREREYTQIETPQGRVSVEGAATVPDRAEMFYTAMRIDGTHGDWDAIYSLDLQNLKQRAVLHKHDLLLPEPFDDVGVGDILDARPGGTELLCSLILRVIHGSEILHCLAVLNTGSGGVKVLTELEGVYY